MSKIVENRPRKSGKYAREKGHAYERMIAKEFREKFGFAQAATSRNTNRLADAQGIDLQGTEPFAIQCKNTARTINYPDVLKGMQHKQEEYPVIFSKVTNKGEFVILRKEDFCELLLMLKKEGVL